MTWQIECWWHDALGLLRLSPKKGILKSSHLIHSCIHLFINCLFIFAIRNSQYLLRFMTWHIKMKSQNSDFQPQVSKASVTRPVNTYHQTSVVYVSAGCSCAQRHTSSFPPHNHMLSYWNKHHWYVEAFLNLHTQLCILSCAPDPCYQILNQHLH